MIAVRPSACARHRAVLLDFVDRRETGRETAAALQHLDRCRACAEELSDVALTITGLRRIHAQVVAAEPPADAWPRLLTRISRPNPAPWRWPATLAGLMTSAMLVAVLVAPFAVDGTSRTEVVTSLPPTSAPLSKIERAYLDAARRLPPSVDEVEAGGQGSVPRIYPDGIRPTEKEVNPTNATGRPFSVI